MFKGGLIQNFTKILIHYQNDDENASVILNAHLFLDFFILQIRNCHFHHLPFKCYCILCYNYLFFTIIYQNQNFLNFLNYFQFIITDFIFLWVIQLQNYQNCVLFTILGIFLVTNLLCIFLLIKLFQYKIFFHPLYIKSSELLIHHLVCKHDMYILIHRIIRFQRYFNNFTHFPHFPPFLLFNFPQAFRIFANQVFFFLGIIKTQVLRYLVFIVFNFFFQIIIQGVCLMAYYLVLMLGGFGFNQVILVIAHLFLHYQIFLVIL